MSTERRGIGAAAAIAALLSLVTGNTSSAATQRVSFRTDDGVSLSATWYEPSTRVGPAVVLVHMLHRSRRDWDAFASRLASEGIGALAIDLRGHGDSQAWAPGEPADYSALVQDVRAARKFLSARSDVQPTRIGIAGASLGANLAVLEAAGDPAVASLALLSPSLDYRGLRIETAVRKFAHPILLVASDDDPYALRSCRELQKAGGGPRELFTASRAGHGTMMVTHDSDVSRALVDWFRRTLI
jgi:alpha-beta hydrolase superfamily lysophospholipase